jgi:hypothetical protein
MRAARAAPFAALADVASPGDGAAPRSIASITSGFT